MCTHTLLTSNGKEGRLADAVFPGEDVREVHAQKEQQYRRPTQVEHRRGNQVEAAHGREHAHTVAPHADAGVQAVEEDTVESEGRVHHVQEKWRLVRRKDLVT